MAEDPAAAAPYLAEARQMEDRLGLTPRAMRFLLWDVAPEKEPTEPTPMNPARRRIKAV